MNLNTPPAKEKIIDQHWIGTWQWIKWFDNLYKFIRGIERDVHAINIAPDNSSSDVSNIEKDLHALNVAPLSSNPHVIHTPFGEFYDTTTQTAAAINTAYPITYNTVVFADGVELGTPASRIYIWHAGIYNIQFSVELAKSSANLGQVWIWSRINGVDQVDSAGRIGLIGSNADTIASWNYVIEVADGDYFELVWATDDTGCVIKSEAATAFAPAVPSILITITDNIKSVHY